MDLNETIYRKASNGDKNKEDVTMLNNTSGDIDEDTFMSNNTGKDSDKATAEERAAKIKQHRDAILKKKNLEDDAKVQYHYWKHGELKCEFKKIR